MKAKLIVIMAAALLVFSGCEKKEEATPAPAADVTEQQTGETAKAEDKGEETKSEPAAADTKADTKEAAPEKEEEMHVIWTDNTAESDEEMVSDSDHIKYALIRYPGIELSAESAKRYPKLARTLKDEVTDTKVEYLRQLYASLDDAYDGIENGWFTYTNSKEGTVELVRADDAMMIVLIHWDESFNGPHPNFYSEVRAYDTQTGERIPFSDIINGVDNMRSLPDIIVNHLTADANDGYVFDESEKKEMLPAISDMVAENGFAWALTEGHLMIYFSADDLMGHAFGPISADIPLDEYPDLILEQYRPVKTKTPASSRLEEKTGTSSKLSLEDLKELYGELDTGYGQGRYFRIECPDWNTRYVAPGIEDDMEKSPFEFKELSKETYMFAEDWAKKAQRDLPPVLSAESYDNIDNKIWTEDDGFHEFTARNYDIPGEIKLEVRESGNGEGADDNFTTYDFSDYLNTPTPGNEFTTSYIRCAASAGDTLCVEIAHMTYAEDQPCTGYIVAVDMKDGSLLWRSDMRVANGVNFILGDEVLICGYGFTQEDDFLYVLSTKTGRTLKSIKLKNAPDYFLPTGDELYVLTYDTAYDFLVERKN